MKYYYTLLIFVYFLLFIMTSSCVDFSKPQADINTILVDSQVLLAMKDQIASQTPMHGGILLGAIQNNEIKIQYFFYDYAGSSSSGGYKPGANINEAAKTALGYKDADGKKPLALFLGHTHSMPGTMNYVVAGHEKLIENSFAKYPDQNVYVILIITIGPENMRTIESHEIKLGDNAKVGFFIKQRNQSVKKITTIKTFDSDTQSYKRIDSFVNSIMHIVDSFEKFVGVGNGKVKRESETKVQNLGIRDKWVFLMDIPLKRKEIQINFNMKTYPKTSPELFCIEKDAHSDSVRTIAVERMRNWQSNEKNPKNFEEFFEDFITTKCPIK